MSLWCCTSVVNSLFKWLQKAALYLGVLKYPAYVLLLISIGGIITGLFYPWNFSEQKVLFASFITLIWSILLIIYPIVYKDIPDVSLVSLGWLSKIKLLLWRLVYLVVAIFFLISTLALLLLTLKMLHIN